MLYAKGAVGASKAITPGFPVACLWYLRSICWIYKLRPLPVFASIGKMSVLPTVLDTHVSVFAISLACMNVHSTIQLYHHLLLQAIWVTPLIIVCVAHKISFWLRKYNFRCQTVFIITFTSERSHSLMRIEIAFGNATRSSSFPNLGTLMVALQ